MYNRAVLAHWKELGVMPSLEERVAYLEGRFGEQVHATDSLRDDVASLRDDMNRRFDSSDARLERTDARFDRIDVRLDGIDSRIERHFTWLVGLQMASLLAVFGAIVSRLFK